MAALADRDLVFQGCSSGAYAWAEAMIPLTLIRYPVEGRPNLALALLNNRRRDATR